MQTRVSRGDLLVGMRRHAAAQSEFRQAAEIVRRQGRLPSFTLWHLACAYYYQGDPRGAAAVMEQLAAEAARNGEGGRGRSAATQVADLAVLLRSPYMPAPVREHLNARMNPPGAVAIEP